MGNYGVEQSKKIAESLALVINTGEKLVKGSFWAIVDLLAPYNMLHSVDFKMFTKEVGELDEGERQSVEQAFASKLNLTDKVVEQKLIDGADALNDVADLVNEGIVVFNDAMEVVKRFRTILGVAA